MKSIPARRRPSGRAFPLTWALAAALAAATPAWGQDLSGPGEVPGHPVPRARLVAVAQGLELRLAPPEGWSLYAPERPGEPTWELGLPLTLFWEGGTPISATPDWPRGVRPMGVQGEARVYEEPVSLRLPPAPAGAERIELRWALCREDLCVPGRSWLPLDPGHLPTP